MNDPLWYKDAILYEVPVRAFADDNGDGHGDFKGLTRKLDYLQDLGVTALWLLPFYLSPHRDDGYDIADYTSVHPQYGTLDDLREFLDEAHRRSLKVITELVLNHTSDQHPWFQRARLAPPGSPERDFYVWSDSPDKYRDARIIFKDYEPSNWTWDPVAKQYYWHRFYHHQPDLNFDHPAVWEAIFPILDYWMELGVDGMRLDAIPYLYEREGTNCENLPETHEFLKALRKRMDEKYPGRMFLAEANQWPEDVRPYFGGGDECHMAFHFPVMPRLFMGLHQEDRFPILDILEQTPPIPDSCQWCMFLRNHDELTLEMVTDEERDYMYRAYAEDRAARINLGIRRRLAPLLKNDRRRIELLNALLFSLPGTPVLYYGDEIGMGDNIYLGDRNGVRTPMQWSGDRNAGFSRANPQRLYLPVVIDPEYHYEAVNVEAMQNNSNSLLWWMKRLIGLRKKHRAFGRGTFEALRPANPKILAFLRRFEGETILVVANLSRFVQFVELDLQAEAGSSIEEVFGRTPFPRVGDAPYRLTLGPHAFFWFSLARPDAPAPADRDASLPHLRGPASLADCFSPLHRDELEALLPAYLTRRRFGRTESPIATAVVAQAARIGSEETNVWFLIVRSEFRDALPELHSLALTCVPEDRLGELLLPPTEAGLARIDSGVICDALASPRCCRAVLRGILAGRTRPIPGGELVLAPIGPRAAEDEADALDALPLSLHLDGRYATTVSYGDRYVLKAFHRVEEGPSPAAEAGRHLMRSAPDAGFAPLAGSVEYRRAGAEPATLDMLYRFVPNQGTAWHHAMDELSRYFERVAALSRESPPAPPPPVPLFGECPDCTDDTLELIGGFVESARQLGRRTAAIHLALARLRDPAFAPEPLGKLYQRSLYQGLRNSLGKLMRAIDSERRNRADVDPLIAEFLAGAPKLLEPFHRFRSESLTGRRIRIHGDYHLARLLNTGRDFVVTDFEGDPARTLDDRRIKRSPLRDVAAMICSLDYAVNVALLGLGSRRGHAQGVIRDEDVPALRPWAEAWFQRISREFLQTYLREMESSKLLPDSEAERRDLMEFLLLEQRTREAAAELEGGTGRVSIPLRGILRSIPNRKD
ncbi:MAG: maltose alpha-D-glucosyltransferase [Gemmataceae bacterium]